MTFYYIIVLSKTSLMMLSLSLLLISLLIGCLTLHRYLYLLKHILNQQSYGFTMDLQIKDKKLRFRWMR